MLPTTARTTHGARSMRSQCILASKRVSPSTIVAISLQQQRDFCFGSWKARGGRRGFRYRSIEAINNRQLSWDNPQQTGTTKPLTKKHIVLPTKPSSESNPGSSYAKVEDIKSWSDDLSGLRPGRNIEDVEREAINHLFAGRHGGFEHELWRSPLSSLRDYLLKPHHAPKEVTPQEVLNASIEPEATRIDPITNRRVSSLPKGFSTMDAFTPKAEENDQNATLSTQQSQAPEYMKGVHKYGPQKWNEPDGLPGSTAEELSKQYQDLHKYNPVLWNEPNGLQQPTSEEMSKSYQDLDHYKSPTLDNPQAPKILSQEELSKAYKDLGKYKPASWNEPDGKQDPSPEVKSKVYQDLNSYEAIQWNEPNGLPQPTPEEISKTYDDLHEYRAVKWNEPDGLRKPTAEELSKNYEDLDKYNPVRWNEPDGLAKPTAEEASKEYRDLAEYGAVRWNEPDGLRPLTPEEASKSYDDVNQYQPVTWNEPDGLRQLTPEEKSKAYGDLKAYNEPFVAKNSVLEEYAKSQLDTTPKGKVLPPKVEVASEDPAKEYNDLAKYGPVHWNEPDGLRPLTPEELSKNYDDLDRYGPVKWNEPDGLPPLTSEELSKQYKDVDAYAAKEPTGPEVIPDRVHPEEASKDYKDLGAYGAVRWNEPDGLPELTPEEKSKSYPDLPGYSARDAPSEDIVARRHPEEISKDYKDLGAYASFENDCVPPIHPEVASKLYQDLDKYTPREFISPFAEYPIHPEEASKAYPDLGKYSANLSDSEMTERIHPEELTKNYQDLDNYVTKTFDSASKPYPVHPEMASKNYQDLVHYAKPLNSDPEGLPKENRDSTPRRLEQNGYEADGNQPRVSSLGRHYGRVNGTSSGPSESSRDPIMDNLDNLTAQDVRADILRKVQNQDHIDTLEDAKTEHESSWDIVASEAKAKLQQAKCSSAEFHFKPLKESSSSGGSSENNHQRSSVEVQEHDQDEPGLGSMDESFPSTTFKPDTKLDQPSESSSHMSENSEANKVAPSSSSTGKGPINSDDWLPTMTPLVVKHYSAKQTLNEPSNCKNDQVVSHKMLAYDASSDMVRVADSISGAHDSSQERTSSELVLGLSNPAKFFPHISRLQKQGYEMVSGNKDVLILRKVRELTAEEEAEIETEVPHSRVNPIDLMGRPVTGNFASPTGFVNYDTVADPISKSRIAASHSTADEFVQEPTKNKTAHGQRRKKRSLGKKLLLGVAWTAGAAYAVGVMAEYFTRAT